LEKGRVDGLPKMLGFQAEGAAPIVRGNIIERPETIATAIRIATLPVGSRRWPLAMNPGD